MRPRKTPLQRQIRMQAWKGGSLTLAFTLVLGVLAAASTTFAGAQTPPILPPQARAHGMTSGEWATAWWQWALSIPADRNPVADETGAFCQEDQSGPVWFLAGTFGTDVERHCSVPEGKTIFMPVYNWIFGAGVFDCEPTVPGVACDMEDLREGAAANTEAADILEVAVDGVAVQDVRQYRASSPEPFSLDLPEGNVLGAPAGTYSPHVADGYWLMLAPLSVGEHEIRVHVRAPDTIFGLIEFEVVYHLSIQPQPRIIPPFSRPFQRVYGKLAARWWQWALGTPADRNPVTDETGEFCHENQTDFVWYLAGTFGNSVERECSVPGGKFIFMPVYNWIFGAGVFDCEPTVPGVTCDVEDLRAGAAANTEAADVLEVTVDGIPIWNVRDYRAASEEPFSLELPEDNVLGAPAGSYSPNVADGYWLLLAPPSVGEHEIRVHVRAPDTIFGLIEFEVVYHLTVVPGGQFTY